MKGHAVKIIPPKIQVNLQMPEDVAKFYEDLARDELEEECSNVNVMSLARRKCRLMTEILTTCKEGYEHSRDI